MLAVSFLLRGVLIFRGGQNYWPDEVRYQRSRVLEGALRSGDWPTAVRVLALPDHAFFTVVGLVPAALESATRPSAKIPALFFALFSVGAILLVGKLMRVLGEDERTSLLAALLLALSTTWLYYSRHLLPYDVAMALGLGALVVGARRPARVRDSALCGALAAATFLTYNGAWLLTGFALLILAARPPLSARAVFGRVAAAGIGFAMVFVGPAAAAAAAGEGFARRMAGFAATARQGDYAEGWKLPFAYFWHADHLLAVAWAFSLAWALRRIARGDRRTALLVGVAGVLVVYGGLVMVSVVLHRIVVYGRLARQAVPFASVATALAISHPLQASRAWRRTAAVVLVAIAVQAAFNFAPPLTQVFPAEFRILASHVPDRVPGERRLVYAEHIYPVPTTRVPAGTVLLDRPHPLQYLPYQYEGYTARERAALRAADIRMRLIAVSPAPR